MAMSAASVKIEREKLLELLREAKDKKLAMFDESTDKHNERLVELRERVATAAAADLSKEKNLDALCEEITEYLKGKSYRRYQWDEGLEMYVDENGRAGLEKRYDSAIRLVEISSDDQFKVTSNTEFGNLLGL